MKISRIKTVGWGGLEDGEQSFSSGLNFIEGPNEAGKSSLVEAILAGLYGDATSESVKLHQRRRWGDDGDFTVELTLEHAGGTYTLTRDFGEKQNRLRTPAGKTIRDKRKIAATVGELTGLASMKAFAASACVLQEDLPAVCGEPALRQSLERQVAGSGIDIDGLLKRLERESTEILSRSAKKGRLAELRSQAEELEREFSEKKAKLSALSASKKKLVAIEGQLESESLKVETDEAAFGGYGRFRQAEANQKQAIVDFESAHEAVETFLATTKEQPKLEKDVKDLAKRIAGIKDATAKAEDHTVCELEVKRLEKDTSALGKRLKSVQVIDKSILGINKKLESVPHVGSNELARARKLRGEAESLEKALASCLIGVAVVQENASAFTISCDGKPVRGAKAKAHVAAEIRFPGAGSVKVQNLTGEKQPLTEQLKRAEESLVRLLEKHAVTSVGELQKLRAKRSALEGERQRLEDRKEGVLGGEDLAELHATSRELAAQLSRAERKREKMAGFVLSKEELKAKKDELVSLWDEHSEKEEALIEARGVLAYLDTDEKTLIKARDETSKRLAMANAAARDTQPFACAPSEYAKLERRLSRRMQKVEDLEKQKLLLEAQIAAGDTVGQEDVAAIEERLVQKRAVIERFEREKTILETFAENVRLARESAIAGLASGVEKRMESLLSAVTEARYSRAQVDGNLEIAIYSGDKSDYIELGNGDQAFSTGTKDLVYVAARLALLEALTGDSAAPLILDDAFSNFDPERRDRAFEVLEAIARTRQILFFSCHEPPDRYHSLSIGGSTAAGSKR